jgi:hypothetical protein|tara:strand:- start:12509 stop:12892 length:384 start_codon:yes stop_codon:yes gene_type:complete
MSMWQFMTDNIDGIVKPLMKQPGYPTEYDYDPDPQVIGALSHWLVDNSAPEALFDDLIQHYGHEVFGFPIIKWYDHQIKGTDVTACDTNFRTFLSYKLYDYAMSLLSDKSDDLISYYAGLQKEQNDD